MCGWQRCCVVCAGSGDDADDLDSGADGELGAARDQEPGAESGGGGVRGAGRDGQPGGQSEVSRGRRGEGAGGDAGVEQIGASRLRRISRASMTVASQSCVDTS